MEGPVTLKTILWSPTPVMQKIKSVLHEISDLAVEFPGLSFQSAAWLLLAAEPVFTTIHTHSSCQRHLLHTPHRICAPDFSSSWKSQPWHDETG